MGDDAALERAVVAAPDDDAPWLVYADWLDERADDRGPLIRAWFALRDAAVPFALAVGCEPAPDDFAAFGRAAAGYRERAAAADRPWLWRLGAARPWVSRHVGRLILTHDLWARGRDWQGVEDEPGDDASRGWLFAHDDPAAPGRQPEDGYPTFYVVHPHLGTVGHVGSAGSVAAMWNLEGLRSAPRPIGGAGAGEALDRYSASHVYVLADTDHGEGWIEFQWPDQTYGYEQLTIALDGHCSRRMPIHSGSGPPEFVEVDRDRIRLRFDAALARGLGLAEEVEIAYRLTDEEFEGLRRVVDYFGGATT